MGFLLFIVSVLADSFWKYDPTSLLFILVLLALWMLALTGRGIFIVSIVLVSCFAEQFTHISALGILCLLFCALLIWGYEERNRLFSALLPLCAAILFAGLYHYHTHASSIDYAGVILYALVCLLPWTVGILLQKKDIEKQNLQLQARLREVEQDLAQKNRDTNLARMLHDSVTGNLSLIMLLVDEIDPLAEKPKNMIRDLAQESLHKLHTAIDALDNCLPSTQIFTDDLQEGSGIRELCLKKDKQMNEAGCHGEAMILGDETVLVPRESIDLIGELYANILRHCNGLVYSFAIKIQKEGVRIMQSNDYTDEWGASMSGGKGLALHRQAIEKRGGTLYTSKIEGSWLVNAWVPAVEEPVLQEEELLQVSGGSSISIFSGNISD